MKLTLLEALALYTTKSDVSVYAGRAALLREARNIVNAEKTRLYQAADAEAQTERTLVEMRIYDSSPSHTCVQVTRVFSDGSATTTREARYYANQLMHTFEQGRKAGLREASK
jgi:hypothetical protein